MFTFLLSPTPLPTVIRIFNFKLVQKILGLQLHTGKILSRKDYSYRLVCKDRALEFEFQMER